VADPVAGLPPVTRQRSRKSFDTGPAGPVGVVGALGPGASLPVTAAGDRRRFAGAVPGAVPPSGGRSSGGSAIQRPLLAHTPPARTRGPGRWPGRGVPAALVAASIVCGGAGLALRLHDAAGQAPVTTAATLAGPAGGTAVGPAGGTAVGPTGGTAVGPTGGTAVGTAAPGAGTAQLSAALESIGRARAAAFATLSQPVLRQADQADSPAEQADLALIRRLRERGYHLEGVRYEVSGVRVLGREGAAIRVRAMVTTSGHRQVGPDAGASATVPPDGPRAVVFTIVPVSSTGSTGSTGPPASPGVPVPSESPTAALWRVVTVSAAT
jgi:hypothetical protein